MEVNVEEIAGAIGGISLAALGFGAVVLLPRRISASYERDLANNHAGSASAFDGLHKSGSDKVLAKYSALNLAQSRISFVASIVFASLGFLVILSGVAVVVFKLGSLTSAAIPSLSGAVVETVAGLFFTINRRTQMVMLEFYNKLRSDQRVEYAIEIAKDLPDRHMNSRLRALLALQFTEAAEVPELFRQLLQCAEPTGDIASLPAEHIPQPRSRQDGSGDLE